MGTHGERVGIASFVLCLASFVLPARADVVINEVQSANDQTPVTDDAGEAMDWVELYNGGDAAVGLGGWGLSDNGEKKPFKWTFPEDVSIPANGHLVVICDKTAQSKDHPVADFGLGADGETLTLTMPDGTAADTVTFGRIPCDCSYGRVGDGGADLKWFADPTPGAANDRTAYEEPLGPVAFSRERGVFTGSTNFTVALSYDADPEATIRYTTDHGDPSESNGSVYGEPIRVSQTTIIRATAVKEGHLPYRNITTHSYIYLDQVVGQEERKPSCAPGTWSDIAKTAEDRWIEGGRTGDPEKLDQGGCTASYGVSTRSVLTGPTEKAQFVEALKAAPIVSITLSDMDLFNSDKSKGAYGVYAKPVLLDGREDGKRAASVEWVTGNHVFCTDAGLSAHGDASRHFDYSPKKSFGLKFRGRYGASKLEVPIFDDVGYDGAEFKSLVLRGESNNSWTHVDNPQLGTSMHDQFLRDVSGAMTGFQSHGNQVHLFLNGLYWGLYNVCEAMDDHFAAALMGGENEQYDVLSGNGHEPTGIAVSDGSADDFNALMIRLRAVKDRNDGGRELYETACAEVNIDGLIDYMLIEWYCGNTDWPHKNWKAALSKELGSPLTYFAWDLDASMKDVGENRVSAVPEDKYRVATNSVQNLQRWLEKSAEYRLRFADHVHRHFYNGGALAAENLVARYTRMAERIRPMVFAEVARWGAYRSETQSGSRTQYTMSTWENRYRALTTDYLPYRGDKVLGQLRAQGLYPTVEAAEFTVAEDRKSATLRSAPSGATVYYTTDGSDPREAYTGAARGTEYRSGETIVAPLRGVTVRARARAGDVWSALSEFELEATAPAVNTFLPAGNGFNWDEDANWSDGRYPDAPGAGAAIGVPNEVKSEKKNWRNVKIDTNDVTVGSVEVTNGGWTNRITSSGNAVGSLVFDGGTNGLGEAQNATFTVTDAAGAGLTMIDLDAPNVVRLDSDTTFTVDSTAGDANYGGLLVKGTLVGNGHDLKKAGAGRMTLACSNADGTVFATGADQFRTVAASATGAGKGWTARTAVTAPVGEDADGTVFATGAVTARPEIGKLQCEGGVLAVLGQMKVAEITKTGELWVKAGSTDLGEAVAAALTSEGKCNPNVGVFVPTAYGDSTWYGGVVATKFGGTPTAYVPDASGEVTFDGRRWTACAAAEIDTATTADGAKTLRVKVPYFGPAIRVGGTDYATLAEAVAAANSRTPMVFATEPTVDGGAHTVAIADGTPVPVADYYDLTLEEDRRTVALTLNAKAQPVSVLATRTTLAAGRATERQFEGLLLRKGLEYAWGQGGVAKTEWIKGDDTPHEMEKPEGDGWELLVRE